jgi:DNA invertase Pin-like site-specific DNA recombinase/DNA-binding transcriptional regulator YiaG
MAERLAQKVTAAHLRRDAYLYVRQSTLRQVLENTESTQRQYALRSRAVALGWPEERVHVIDRDLGQSGASAADRAGFQELVSEVSLGHAGLVLGLEVSRLARNSADWHRLLELCAVSDTLILDEDGLYDSNDFNDRLLLGLKGTMSEAELHFLRARLRGGLLNKARRGELVCPLPVGLLYDEQDKVRLDPDQQVQQAVRLFFETFQRTGTASATVKAFREAGLVFPRRLRAGARKGELVWGALGHARALEVLHNPRYAGAFSYGRRPSALMPQADHSAAACDPQNWLALVPHAHPGYITWETFEANQRQLYANAQAQGAERRHSPAGEGPALLQGLVLCGVCGQRMTVRYHLRSGQLVPEYMCQRAGIEHAQKLCQQIAGQAIDAAIAEQLLAMLNPLALEVALAVQAEIEAEHAQVERLRAQQVERARYEAELARQRYVRVDPNHRLVASTLEAEWNAALRTLEDAQRACEQQRQQERALMDQSVRARVQALATDFPRLWCDPQTSDRERKRMVRLLVADVTLLKQHAITVQVRFRGGTTSSFTLPAPQRVWESWQTPAAIVAEIDALLHEHTDQQIAVILNARGRVAGKGGPFNAQVVARIRKVYGLQTCYERLRAAGRLTKEELATQLGISSRTVKIWHSAGLLRGKLYNNKRGFLYDPPGPNAPIKHARHRLQERRQAVQLHTQSTEEVQLAG